jgi:hypothetical protein
MTNYFLKLRYKVADDTAIVGKQLAISILASNLPNEFPVVGIVCWAHLLK